MGVIRRFFASKLLYHRGNRLCEHVGVTAIVMRNIHSVVLRVSRP